MTVWLIFALAWLALACLIGGVHEAIRKVRNANRVLHEPFMQAKHCTVIPNPREESMR